MALGVMGRKLGMTRVFNEDGVSVPVTVIEVQPNRVVRLLDAEREGYRAAQLSSGEADSRRLSRAEAGHFSRHDARPGARLREFRLEAGEEPPAEDGALTVQWFQVGQKVNVTGVSRGKGFQSGIRRWNFRGQDNSHGNSKAHRSNGSIGQCQTPGRVWKGKKMSGRMGNAQVTVRNLGVVQVDEERNLLLVRGATPGASNAELLVRPARGCLTPPEPPAAGEPAAEASAPETSAAEAPESKAPESKAPESEASASEKPEAKASAAEAAQTSAE